MKAKRSVGRPTKLTPEIQDAIVLALGSGAHLSEAASNADVDPATVRRWMKQGREEPSSIYGEFRAVTQGAIRKAALRFVSIIAQAAQHNPEHAKWLLTHRHPKRWADRSKVQISAKVQSNLEPLSLEEMKERWGKALKEVEPGGDAD